MITKDDMLNEAIKRIVGNKLMKKIDATIMWTNKCMTDIPVSVIKKLMKISEGNDIIEITPPKINDNVYVVSVDEYGEISDHFTDSYGNENYIIKLDSGKMITIVDIDDIEIQYDDALPLYGWMWTFKDPFDIEWLEDNLQTMANCGFRIYESEDYDYVFGIDCISCDFYEHYWIPLYDEMVVTEPDEEVK